MGIAFGDHTIKSRFNRRSTMGNLMKYNAANLNQFLDLINRNSIGMEDYFDRLTTLHETTSNYPPYNLVTVSNVESRLELALAGFKKKEKRRKNQNKYPITIRQLVKKTTKKEK